MFKLSAAFVILVLFQSAFAAPVVLPPPNSNAAPAALAQSTPTPNFNRRASVHSNTLSVRQSTDDLAANMATIDGDLLSSLGLGDLLKRQSTDDLAGNVASADGGLLSSLGLGDLLKRQSDDDQRDDTGDDDQKDDTGDDDNNDDDNL